MHLLLFVILLWTAGCHRKATVQTPAPPAPDPMIKVYSIQGDEYFGYQNLYGWRKAEEYYSEAEALGGAPGLNEKLLLTRVLLLTREIDEDVPFAELQKRLASSCGAAFDVGAQHLCDLAQKYASPRVPFAQYRKVDTAAISALPAFAPGDEALNTYLRILYSQASATDLPHEYELSTSKRYPSSPLFIYLRLRKTTAQQLEQVERDCPYFTELYALNGERQMEARRYRESRASFNKALELVPDYTRALNGLANILLFVAEDWAEALKLYERTLKYDPLNSGALYGKGVLLHLTGSFVDSNRILDQLMAADLTRGGRLDSSNVRYYHGMGQYYQAYNNFRLFNPPEARRLIDLAKRDLPNEDAINFLSGVFYFDANEMANAQSDFMRALSSSRTNCEAYNYLGLIFLQKKESRAATHFLGMCSCLQTAMENLRKAIADLPTMELEPAELSRLRGILDGRQSSSSKSWAGMIKNAITMIDLVEFNGRDTYKKLMREILARVAEESTDP
jgi:tetratricopeptide (TPR) repeat protein